MTQADRTRLILVAHAPLASAFQSLAMHAFPECGGDVVAVDVPPESSLDSAKEAVRTVLQRHFECPVLVLADVQGATPANALAAVLLEFPMVRAVAGLNAPMLWRVLCYRNEPPAQLAERALAGGQRGISSF